MNNEINYLRILKHPNMLFFEELYEDDFHIHIITELLNSGTVSDKKRKKISIFEACFVLKSILELLVYLQKNFVVHRDIKPGNIMFHRTQGNKVNFLNSTLFNCELIITEFEFNDSLNLIYLFYES